MRFQVKLLASWGHTQAEIAAALQISQPTLERRLKDEFREGAAKSSSDIEYNLKRIARDISGTYPIADSLRAIIFYCKTKLGYRETQHVIHGFDPVIVTQFVSQVANVIKRLIPECCPHCKTNLGLRPVLGSTLIEMSEKLKQQLPAPENVPMPAPSQDPG